MIFAEGVRKISVEKVIELQNVQLLVQCTLPYMSTVVAGWSARALARLVDLPVSTVAFWVSNGLVTPERQGKGRGGHTIGLSGLMELLAVAELRQAGFSLQAIRRAVENLRGLSGYPRPLARLTLVIIGKDIVWKDAEELSTLPISALQQPGQRLMVFPLGERHAAFVQQLEGSERSGVAPPHAIEGR